MIVDTSAIVAILRDEPERPAILAALAGAPVVRMSAGTRLELAIVIRRLEDPVVERRVEDLLEALRMSVEPFTVAHGTIAQRAFADFGRGSGHPARLNFGDCFAYALARESGEPLLFKGDDFTHTDVAPAL